jgi:hypothetical protein
LGAAADGGVGDELQRIARLDPPRQLRHHLLA